MSAKVSTVAKGNAFEDKVYDILQQMIEKEELPINGKKSKLFKKKKYKTTDGSDSEIEIDVSIETYLNDDSKPSILTLIECKNYSSAVDVSEVRDFYTRILQLNAHKGIMFSTAKFQEGAYKLANAKNIGLIRVGDDKSLDWILNRISTKEQYKIDADIRNYVIEKGKKSESHSFGAVFGSRVYANLLSVLSDELDIIKPKSIKIKYLSVEQMKKILYAKVIEEASHSVISNEVLEEIVNRIGYKLEHKQLQEGVLGCVDFSKKIITISNTLSYGCVRWRFSIAHEIGHIILHSELLTKHSIKEITEGDVENTSSYFNDKNILYLERQANRFASLLLINENEFKRTYAEYHLRKSIRRYPKLYLDNQPCNISTCNEVFRYMADHFQVSKETIKIQFEHLNLLIEDKSNQPQQFRRW